MHATVLGLGLKLFLGIGLVIEVRIFFCFQTGPGN